MTRRNRKESDARYRAENAEKIAAYQREYRRKNAKRRAEATARWRKENPEKIAAQYRRRSGVTIAGSLTSTEWIDILNLFSRQCAYCCSSGKVTLDHVVPISKGGLHEASNVVPACAPCNTSKAARDLREWLSDPHTRASSETCHLMLSL